MYIRNVSDTSSNQLLKSLLVIHNSEVKAEFIYMAAHMKLRAIQCLSQGHVSIGNVCHQDLDSCAL